jgi:hypothetical protein
MDSQFCFQKKISQFIFSSLVLIAPLILLSMSSVKMPDPPSGSISGTVIYYGNTTGHNIIIEAFRDLMLPPSGSTSIANPGGSYTIFALGDDTYYVRAYLDLNDNGSWNGGEPGNFFDPNWDASADKVTISGGAAVKGIDIAVGNIIYVNPDNPFYADGSSWMWGYTTLQAALADPKTATAGTEIWIKRGTYKPGITRANTFQLKNGVAIYGGFAGTEFLRNQRDLRANLTILSGELTPGNIYGNVYHVVTGSGTNSTAILSDVTIMYGAATESSPDNAGGGMLNDNGSPTIVNARFFKNYAATGGGMANLNSANPTVINCLFAGNSADFGGSALLTWLANGSVTNTTFTGNSGSKAISMYGFGYTLTLNNVIVYSNPVGGIESLPNGSNQYGLITVFYSIMQGVSCPSYTTCDATVKFVNPLFTDADGPDDVYGTLDDNPRLQFTSPAIDAGKNSAVPVDIADLDGDGNTTEATPIDLSGSPRLMNVGYVADTGSGTPPIVDMGAYETYNYVFIPLVLK